MFAAHREVREGWIRTGAQTPRGPPDLERGLVVLGRIRGIPKRRVLLRWKKTVAAIEQSFTNKIYAEVFMRTWLKWKYAKLGRRARGLRRRALLENTRRNRFLWGHRLHMFFSKEMVARQSTRLFLEVLCMLGKGYEFWPIVHFTRHILESDLEVELMPLIREVLGKVSHKNG